MTITSKSKELIKKFIEKQKKDLLLFEATLQYSNMKRRLAKKDDWGNQILWFPSEISSFDGKEYEYLEFKNKHIPIQNLVWNLFGRKLEDDEELEHIDGNIHNNHINNLKIKGREKTYKDDDRTIVWA